MPDSATQKPSRLNLLRPVVIFLVMAFCGWFVYHPLFKLAFWGDDTFLMNFTARNTLSDLLFGEPARILSRSNFMPLVGVFFRLDHLLFGLNFTGRNIHSLIWLITVGYLGYALLFRLGLKLWTSVAGGVVLLVSPAAVSVAGLFSNRNYLFGLAFALLSLVLLMNWIVTSHPVMFFSAVCFYFLALCSKEIYAPLPVLAGFIVWQRKTGVAKTLWAYMAAFGLYLLLRRAMTGSVVGGYTQHLEGIVMLSYLVRSLPRLLETVVWGSAVPGVTNRPAAILGCLIVLSTAWLAITISGWRGLVYYCVLLALSLCVVSLALYAPIIRYADDPLYCHGDRLALAFSTVIWFSLIYCIGRLQNTGAISDKNAVLLCFAIIVPLMYYGGLKKAQSWKMEKASLSQVTFVNDNAAQRWLVIAAPTWSFGQYLDLLRLTDPGVRIQSLDSPGRDSTWYIKDYPVVYRIRPNQPILHTGDPIKIQRWSKEPRAEFCKIFPFLCTPRIAPLVPAPPAH